MPRLYGWLSVLVCLLGCTTLPEIPVECSIHHLPLKEELVMVRTGEPRLEYQRARKSEFPYCAAIYSGQLPPANVQVMERALVCPSCSRAEREWVRKNFW
jgi:hypothetical protein